MLNSTFTQQNLSPKQSISKVYGFGPFVHDNIGIYLCGMDIGVTEKCHGDIILVSKGDSGRSVKNFCFYLLFCQKYVTLPPRHYNDKERMFRFKQFSVRQDKCAMKVGTDGVLLGAWCGKVRLSVSAPRLLDVGTGTGLIALMLAQKFTEATVTAIDIDHDAVVQAQENISSSPFSSRVRTQETAFQDFHPDERYDLIVSNPPYFVNSQKCPDSQRTLARHADSLPLEQLISHGAKLLAPQGKIAVIIPVEIQKTIERYAAIYGLFVAETLLIATTPRKAASRALLLMQKDMPEEFITRSATIHNTDGDYTDWYRELTCDFYLY